MGGADPADTRGTAGPTARSANLALRVASSLVLAPLALGAAYLGGLTFLAFWAIAATGVLWEWDNLVCAHDRNAVFAVGAVVLAGACAIAGIDQFGLALVLIVLGALAVATLSSTERRMWCLAGLGYAAAIVLAPVLLRRDAGWGFAAIILLFTVVWLTDIAAFFGGRAIGGPKLMPRVSPNKTWAGALSGAGAAMLGGLAVAKFWTIGNVAAVVVLAFVLSVTAQAGDLFESALKRRFHAKDTGKLLPGHGGVMDRLDGFVAAATFALLIGTARGGVDGAARGLMVW